jgi:hypothetical protein
MPTESSPPVVALSAPANLSMDGFGPATDAGSFSREVPRVPSTLGVIWARRAGLSRGLRRLVSTFGAFGEVLAVAYAFPLLILAIGVPAVLLLRLAMWVFHAL